MDRSPLKKWIVDSLNGIAEIIAYENSKYT